MKISYDKTVDAMYVSFKKGKYDRTKKITDSILVDLSAKNEVLGLEILDASKNIGVIDEVRIKVDRIPKRNATL